MDIRNWFRLELLLDRANTVFRELFKRRWKEHAKQEWEEGNTAFATLIEHEKWYKRIGNIQKKSICSGKTNDWDLTTLGIILNNFKFDHVNIQECKREYEFINKVLSVRNITAHLATKQIPIQEFETHWNTVSGSLVVLGDSADELDKLRSSNANGIEFRIANAYQDEANTKEALTLKDQGNNEFNSNNFQKAVNIYTRAIQLGGIPDYDKAILYCNRSVAYLKWYLSSNENADKGIDDLLYHSEEDAQKACSLRPNWSKAYFRLGEVHSTRGTFKEAVAYYDSALATDPNNQEIQNARSNARLKLGAQERQEHLDPRFQPKAMEEINREVLELHKNRSPPLMFDEFQKVPSMTPEEIECLQLCHKAHQHMNGMQNMNPDDSQAAYYFEKAASKGGAEGIYNLAIMYISGKGVKQDIQLGVKMLKEAAAMPPYLTNGLSRNLGVTEAQHALGLYFENGIGMDKNCHQAEYWYRKAASYGSPNAANNLGLMLLNGNGIQQNAEEGVRYLKQAANGKDPNAMGNLASYYLLSGDAMEGLKWIRRSADTGSVHAKVRVKEFEVAVKKEEEDFKKSGIEEWEREQKLGPNNLTIRERIKRMMEFQFPELLHRSSKFDEVIKSFSSPVPESIIDPETYDYNMLQKHAQEGSVMAQRLCRSQEFFVKAVLLLNNNSFSNLPDMTTCIHFVHGLAMAFKLEYFCILMPLPLRELLKKVSSTVISHSKSASTDDEAARICYSVMIMTDYEASIAFLTTSIQLYPRNPFFYKLRSASFGFLKKFGNALEDTETGLTLQPNDFTLLYHKAVALRNLEDAKSNRIIQAYEQYLKHAPKDERKVPEAYYCIALEYREENQLGKRMEYYKLGQEAEKIQLPCFLPYASNIKKLLELTVNPIEPQSQSNPSSPAVVLTRHEMDNSLIVEHRQSVSSTLSKDWTNCETTKNSTKPKLQSGPIKLIGLMAIHLSNMDQFDDHIYEGYVLTVVVIDIPFTIGNSIQTLIEDEKKVVQRIAIYGHHPSGICHRCKCVKNPNCNIHEIGVLEEFMYKEYAIGTKLSIIHPYLRLAADGKPMIQVDDTGTIRKESPLVQPCRACMRENATKHCSRCSISKYCSMKCQKYDWKVLKHKNVCFNFLQ